MMLATASRSVQRKLAEILDRMKASPFRPADFQERDAADRMNEVIVEGEWLMTYWLDHAARELGDVRLVRVED